MQFGEIIGHLLINLQSIIRKNISFQSASFQQLLGLFVLELDGMEMTNFALKLGVDNSTATRMIIGLEEKGWVQRSQHIRDRRIVKVSLTALGLKIQKTLEQQLQKIGKNIQQDMDTKSEQDILESITSLNWILLKIKLNNIKIV